MAPPRNKPLAYLLSQERQPAHGFWGLLGAEQRQLARLLSQENQSVPIEQFRALAGHGFDTTAFGGNSSQLIIEAHPYPGDLVVFAGTGDRTDAGWVHEFMMAKNDVRDDITAVYVNGNPDPNECLPVDVRRIKPTDGIGPKTLDKILVHYERQKVFRGTGTTYDALSLPPIEHAIGELREKIHSEDSMRGFGELLFYAVAGTSYIDKKNMTNLLDAVRKRIGIDGTLYAPDSLMRHVVEGMKNEAKALGESHPRAFFASLEPAFAHPDTIRGRSEYTPGQEWRISIERPAAEPKQKRPQQAPVPAFHFHSGKKPDREKKPE